ncbi:MAG: succinate dehydrogenase assembly factor 2 [Alphaproteobacteria bacterium]|nr:succinate dehydrogenase assembly factor 2 [Alphaproteobacteria bacterium]
MNKGLTSPALKRLLYRSTHRGCKETDLVLGQFAHTHLHALEEPMLSIYAALLEENDADIWDWLTDKSPPARAEYGPLLSLLKAMGSPPP